MSRYLNRYRFERYRNHLSASNPGFLPTTNAPQSPIVPSTTASTGLLVFWHSICGNIMKALRSWQGKGGTKCQTAATTPPARMASSVTKESYFCVDKYWTRVKQTNMYTVPAIDLLQDDYELFMALCGSLTAGRGSWLHRWSSWRTCTGVKLSKVNEEIHVRLGQNHGPS